MVDSTRSSCEIQDALFDSQGRLFGVQRHIPQPGAKDYCLFALDKITGEETTIGRIGIQDIRALVFAHASATAISENDEAAISKQFALAQNYPNPFNPSTKIRYSIVECRHVQLRIFSILGQAVRTLIDTEQPPRVYEATRDAREDAGVRVASGVYV